MQDDKGTIQNTSVSRSRFAIVPFQMESSQLEESIEIYSICTFSKPSIRGNDCSLIS
eukprot:UN24476